jgi:hypothetical protein
MPILTESLYFFNFDLISVVRDTDRGTIIVKWWANVERDNLGFEYDTWVEITTTEAEIEALKARRITCRAFWRGAGGLTLTREHAGPVGDQSKSVQFADVEKFCPKEGVFLHHQED